MVLASGPLAPGMEPEAAVTPLTFDALHRPEIRYAEGSFAQCPPLTWQALGLAKDSMRHVCTYWAVYKPGKMKNDLTFKPFVPVTYWKSVLEKPTSVGDRHAAAARYLVQLDPNDPDLLMELAENEDEGVRSAAAAAPKAGPGNRTSGRGPGLCGSLPGGGKERSARGPRSPPGPG